MPSFKRSYTTKEITDAFTYCVQVVRTRDFENYVWCTQLAKEIRPAIFALRAFHVETASVNERSGGRALFAQTRFQWWFDAISNLYKQQPSGNPIFKALSCVLQSRYLTRYRLKKIVETRQQDALREAPFESVSELEAYADGTSGQLLRLQLEAADVEEDDKASQEAAALIGRAVGLTNILRGTVHHAQKGIIYFPRQYLDYCQVEVSSILEQRTTEGTKEITQALAEQAVNYIAQARRLRRDISSKAAPSVLLPATVADIYLSALRRHDYDLFDPHLQKHTDSWMLLKLQLFLNLDDVTHVPVHHIWTEVDEQQCLSLVMGANSGFADSVNSTTSLTGLYSNGTSTVKENKNNKGTHFASVGESVFGERVRGSVTMGDEEMDDFAETFEIEPEAIHQNGCTDSVPVFVMLPLDTVNAEGKFKYARSTWFHEALRLLVMTGVKGVAVDVWWGAVEKNPMCYDWSGYRDLVYLIKQTGLQMQCVLSFHACGGNVGDVVQIPLPQWVLQCGESDPDIFLCDRPQQRHGGQRNRECLSIFADNVPGVLFGRSPMQCYSEFMAAFRDEFEPMLGTLITDVIIGAGPCGELRYPSYSEANGWSFPGVGEFQCYDRHALSSLAKAAADAGHREWGHGGPHNSGEYRNWPMDTSFFDPHSGSWNTGYGRFFLQWYSDALLHHGRQLLQTAHTIFASKLRQRPSVQRPSESLMHGFKTWLTRTSGRLCSSPSTASATDLLMSESSVSFSGRTNSVTSILRDTSLDSITQERSNNTCQFGMQSESTNVFVPSAMEVGYSSVFDVETRAFTPIYIYPPQQRPSNSGNVAIGRSSTESDNGDTLSSAALVKRWDAGDLIRRLVRFPKQEMNEDNNNGTIQLNLKIAGVHWWYRSESHAAELTAGYYNAGGRCGYEPIINLCREFNVGLTLTCVEMSDAQHRPEHCCSPQGLLNQVRRAATAAGVHLSGENALPLFFPGQGGANSMGLDRVVEACRGEPKKPDGLGDRRRKGLPNNNQVMKLHGMHSFTLLRLGPEIMNPRNKGEWTHFMQRMHEQQRHRMEDYIYART